jgi:hypothetical protein
LSWSGCDSSPNSREIAQPSRLVSALRRFEQPSNQRATRTKHQTPTRTSDVPLPYRLQIVPATKGQKKTGPSISSVENDQRDHQPWKLTFENTAFGYGVGRICDRTSVGTVLETVTHSFSAFANHSRFFYPSWIRQRHFQDASYYNSDGAEYEEEGWGHNSGQSAAARYHRRSVYCQEFLFELG